MDASLIKSRLKQFIVTEIMHNPEYPLGEDEALITSGLMDSFALAQIGVFAEIEFNVYIPDAELTVDQMNTIEQMAAAILGKLG